MQNTMTPGKLVGLAIVTGLWTSCTPLPPPDGDTDDPDTAQFELSFPDDDSALLVVDEVGGDATMTLKGADDGTVIIFSEWDIVTDKHIVVAFDNQGRPATITQGTLDVEVDYNLDETINFVVYMGGVEVARGENVSLDDVDLDAVLKVHSSAKSSTHALQLAVSPDEWIRSFTSAALGTRGLPWIRLSHEQIAFHPLYACMVASEEAQELAATMNAWIDLAQFFQDLNCQDGLQSQAEVRCCARARETATALASLISAAGEGIGLGLFDANPSCRHECVYDRDCDEGTCETYHCVSSTPDDDPDDPPGNQPPRITEFTAVPDTCPDCFTQRGQGVGGVRLTCKASDVDTPTLSFQIRAVGARERVPAKMMVAAQIQGEQTSEITLLLPGVGTYTFECEVFESNSSISVLSDLVTVSVFPSAPMAGDWDVNYQDCTTGERKGWDSLILYANGEYGIGVAGEHGMWTLDGGQFEADRDPGFFRATVDEGNTHMIGEVISSNGNTTNCFEAWRGCVVREGETCELD